MNPSQRIEMQERTIAILAKALNPDPEMQETLVNVAKVQAMEDMREAVRFPSKAN